MAWSLLMFGFANELYDSPILFLSPSLVYFSIIINRKAYTRSFAKQ